MLGQEVKTLVDGIRNAGYESIEWNASEVASGMYFYRLYAVGVSASGGEATSVADLTMSFTQVRKLLLLR